MKFQILLFAIWIISVGITLIWIQRSNLDNLSKAVWALLVVIAPFLGSTAYIIVQRLGSPPTDKPDP